MSISYLDVSDIDFEEIEESDREYNIDDCVLVRTTDYFPINGVMQTPKNASAIISGQSSYFQRIIANKISEKYPNFQFDEEESRKFNEELNSFNINYNYYRSTIHFTINGLVSSHMYGNFDGRHFTIIDPLKYHLDESLVGLRSEDTYYNDNFILSNESYILIDENYYNDNKNNLELLENMNIIVYKGDQEVAVGQVLKTLGYDSFLISNNGYTNGLSSQTAAGKMYKNIMQYAIENNISQERHFYSDINQEDCELLQEESDIVDKKHLLYVVKNSNVDDLLKNEILKCIENNNVSNKINLLLTEFVNLIGLEELLRLTREFNVINNAELSNNRIDKDNIKIK